ncbi:substrate-binding domain-containing protein [Brucepastera parasyntrophica]|uniref:substrate-binding domain-containing protein n=1 Tax=Brucepastera parasyntrophica TaxID=2880008 RepID=UPI00210A5E5B|nr:substrate-binding domain-containing protein [Brucepastera parasyntrophica]ULQ60797.1 substrate-binding domain-containing protein [Brucepastera parasyntrophica]
MQDHGYTVSDLQAKEKPKNSGLIIFNIPSMENPFYSQIVRGAKSAADRHGYQMVINEEHINDGTIARLTDLIRKVNAAGLITTNHVSTQLLQKLKNEVPLVQCCEFDSSLDIPHVSIDDIAAAKNTMEYLLSLGRRNIAFINGPLRYKYARHRLRGYLDSLEQAGIPEDPGLIIQLPEINYDMAVSSVIQLLNAGRRPDAFFCVSDVYAAAVIKACTRMGLNVPRDVMVSGFDNVNISFMTSPTITTVKQPKFQLGFSSCELLIQHIANPESTVRSILLETELIVRESTASPVNAVAVP